MWVQEVLFIVPLKLHVAGAGLPAHRYIHLLPLPACFLTAKMNLAYEFLSGTEKSKARKQSTNPNPHLQGHRLKDYYYLNVFCNASE